nr:MAG TPA: hypothetical protein [Podoviridae sp. ctY3D12]
MIQPTNVYRSKRYSLPCLDTIAAASISASFSHQFGSHLWVTHALPFSYCFFSYKVVRNAISYHTIVILVSFSYLIYISVSCTTFTLHGLVRLKRMVFNPT